MEVLTVVRPSKECRLNTYIVPTLDVESTYLCCEHFDGKWLVIDKNIFGNTCQHNLIRKVLNFL